MSTATAVKERPILFSGPMVAAILAGRKTQTRRVMKFQPNMGVYAGQPWECGRTDDGQWQFNSPLTADVWTGPCPYGEPGDRLWVRETWRPILSGLKEGGVDYKADDPSASGIGFMQWKPSIHMPRAYSRITLEITDVRVQRLQEISTDDAIAEGCTSRSYPDGRGFEPARTAFWELWHTIHKADGPHGWEANPYVWAITFRRINQ